MKGKHHAIAHELVIPFAESVKFEDSLRFRLEGHNISRRTSSKWKHDHPWNIMNQWINSVRLEIIFTTRSKNATEY